MLRSVATDTSGMESFATLVVGGGIGLAIVLAFWLLVDLIAELQHATRRRPH